MDFQLDLHRLLPALSGYPRARDLAKKIIGYGAIGQDLAFCMRMLDIFWKWHVEKVIALRSGFADESDEGFIGGAIAQSASIYLARAIVARSDIRTFINFDEVFQAANLRKEWLEFSEYRRAELAHYGGFMHRDRPYSDDGALLVSQGGNTYFTIIWARMHSSAQLVSAMARLAQVAQPHAHSLMVGCQNELLNKIIHSPNLRKAICERIPEATFDPLLFWRTYRMEAAPDISPSGPTAAINWEV